MMKVLTVLIVITLAAWAPAAEIPKPVLPWTVETSVARREFAEDLDAPGALAFYPSSASPIGISPDGRRFFFVTRSGDLPADCIRYRLWVFGVEQLTQAQPAGDGPALKPLRTLDLATTVQRQRAEGGAVASPSWVNDDEITFRSDESDLQANYYRWNVATGTLLPLTRCINEIADVPSTANDMVIYAAKANLPEPIRSVEYPAEPLRGHRFFELTQDLVTARYPINVYAGRLRQAPRVVARYSWPIGAASSARQAALAPNGRWAVISLPAHEGRNSAVGPEVPLPAGWSDYYENLDNRKTPIPYDEGRRLWRFVLVDLERGETRVMLDAPSGPLNAALPSGRPNAVWSGDSRHVFLANTALPIGSMGLGAEANGYLVAYEVASGKWSVLEQMDHAEKRVLRVDWPEGGKALVVTHADAKGKPKDQVAYEWAEGKWTGHAATLATSPVTNTEKEAVLAEGWKVALRAGANVPPTIVATKNGQEVRLLEPDPALAGVRIAPQVPFHWTEKSGKVKESGLLLPELTPGSPPPPLVVQLSGYAPERFLPDGWATTAYAAQALVAQGMAVLQLDPRVETDYPEIEKATPHSIETTLMRDRIDRAVEELARQGKIDPARVALLGFSRTGFYVNYVITHPGSVQPVAAMINDSVTHSYGTYVEQAALTTETALRGVKKAGEHQYGGSFWERKGTWIDEAPGFNIEQVRCPVLFTFTSFTSVFQGIAEMMGGFRLAGKPFDILLFANGSHQVVRPRHRAASLQATVDWMAFWLQGRELEPERKAEQYAYWRQLRKQQDEVLKTPPPPKGKWVFVPDGQQANSGPIETRPKDKPAN